MRTTTLKSAGSFARGDLSRCKYLASVWNYSRGALPGEHVPIALWLERGLQTNQRSQPNNAILHIDYNYLKSFEKQPK